MRQILAAITAVVLVVGCGGSTTPTPSNGGPTVPPAAASQPATSGAPAIGGRTYTSVRFDVPLSVTVSDLLPVQPTDDTPGLLSWTNDNHRVRFLHPVEVYSNGTASPMPPPRDASTFLRALSQYGAVLSDEKSLTVGGLPGELLNARTARSLDGVLGCPVAGANQDEGCFGLQPESPLRVAVVDVKDRPLLIWAVTVNRQSDEVFLGAFESMLSTVRFR